MLTIHDRPFELTDRAEAGHWGGELIIGAVQRSASGPLVERQTRLVRLLNLPFSDADALHQALMVRLGDLPTGLVRSITWDQGADGARNMSITQTLGSTIYFCDSTRPGSAGRTRTPTACCATTSPKGTDLGIDTLEHLLTVENESNNHPRMVLDNRTPHWLITALLASENPSVLRR